MYCKDCAHYSHLNGFCMLQTLSKNTNDSCRQFIAHGTKIPSVQIQQKIYNGDIEINTKQELDLFCLEGYSQINGYLAIGYNYNIQSLDGLQNLTTVDGNLLIEHNANLQSLNGLQNLATVGKNLRIEYNNNLQSLDGLQNLTTVGGDLRVICNNKLFKSEINKLVNRIITKGKIEIK